jgi:hypothetical protein
MLKVGRNGRIDIVIGVLAAALLEVRAAHAEAPLGDGLSHLWDQQSAEHVDALLRQAVATGGVESLTADELAKLLTPERLAELGIDAKEFTFLLQADPEAAIARLEAAFAQKLKLASFEAASHKANFAASEDSEGGRHDADGAAASGEGGGISPLLILGGVFGAGLGAALIINGGGGGSSGGAGGQAVNSPPLAGADTVTTAEDGAVTFDPRTNDTDANGDTLTITQINGTNITTTAPVAVTGGTVSLNANGTLTFTPTANYNGTPSFTYTVSDGRGGTGTGTVNLTVTPVNDAPVAVVDTVTTAEDAAVTFDPRANDSDVDGNALTITQINGTNITVTTPVTVTGGVVSLNANGSLTFTPSANFNGTPSFTYTISDGAGGTATSTVNLTVTSVNDAPVAVIDSITTAEDTAVTFDPRANDSDVDGNALTITQINGTNITTTTPVTVTGGVVSLNANGSLTFTPNANFNGTPSFTYTISDGAGGTATSTVNLNITAVNDAPVNGVPGGLSGLQGGTVSFVGLSVSDVDSTALTTTVSVSFGSIAAAAVANGATFTVNANGSITFTGTAAQINASLNGLTYQGGTGGFGTATVTITTSDGALTDTDTFPINITQVQSGVLADGYISGATVFVDTNGNGVFDPGEPTGTTGADGTFALAGATGTLIAFGGINIDTGLPNNVTFMAPAGSGVINPLTTVLVSIMSTGVSLADAQAALATALGFPVGTDFTHLDFLNPNTDPTLALAGQKIAAEIASTLSALAGLGLNVQGLALKAIAAAYATGVAPDLTSSSYLHDLFLSVGVPADQVDALAFQTAATNDTINSATSLGGISDAQQGGGAGGGSSDTLNVSQATIDGVVANAATLHDAGFIHLDVGGATVIGDIHITDAQAGVLIGEGIDFVSDDNVSVETQGTTTSTTLKGLQDLHVDSIAVHSSSFSIDAGAGGLGGLSASGLPAFTTDGPADISLNINGGVLDASLDLSTLAGALAAAGIDHIDIGGSAVVGSLELSTEQTLDLVNAGIDFAAADNITVDASAADLTSLATLTAYGTAHIDHIDVIGDTATISDDAAALLISEGIDFDAGDNITVETQGTTTSTTLKGLQDLHVDSIAVHSSSFSIDAGAGGLGGLSAGGLPVFTTDGPADISLNIDGGVLDTSLDLSTLASSLAASGIDHLDIGGSTVAGSLELSSAQALDLVNAGIDFAAADNITVDLAASDIGSLAALGAAHVDHIDVVGDVATISDATAALLISEGVDFNVGDNITVDTQGTTTSTSLKGLQDLHVDSIAVHGGHFSIDAGAGGLGGLTGDLPTFVIDGTGADPDVSLNIDSGTLDSSLDLSAIAAHLGAAGIDHIDVAGNAAGSLDLTGTQALDLIGAGLNFVEADNITAHVTADQVASSAIDLGLAHVDHLDVIGDVAQIDDGTAALLVGSGVDFATGDDITVAAHGTHMATSLEGLQSLHVDTVIGDGIHNVLKLDVGVDGLAALTSGGALPHFTDSLDVTLDIKLSDLDALAAQAAALHAAGIDHIGLDTPLTDLTSDQLAAIANITASTGLTIDYDPNPAHQNDYGSLISLLESDPATPVDSPVSVPDALAASLVESGAVSTLLQDNLVIDATDSGDRLLTSLKSMADLGVDSVHLADHGAQPVYIDLGFDSATPTSSELAQLLSAVDPDGAGTEPLLSGASHVGLVLDQSALDALAGVTDSIAHLQDLGFTEIDVVGGTSIPTEFASAPIEIKLIGETDDLYDYLHHHR